MVVSVNKMLVGPRLAHGPGRPWRRNSGRSRRWRGASTNLEVAGVAVL